MPLREVARALGALELRGRHVLVAVSGGLDSVCLFHLLVALESSWQLELSVAHVDHGLRGEAAKADARFVGDLATGLGYRFACEQVEPRALREGGSSRARPTLQEAARTLRYAALRGMASKLGADVIATAHTADDQAETVLLRLLRGCGPDGLGGIPERSQDGRVVRPVLAVTREALEGYAAERGVRFREDASNAGDDYARNRLRHHWIPQLSSNFNPRLLRTLGNLAEASRRDAEWIDEQVMAEFERRVRFADEWIELDRAGWAELPEPLARRVVKRLFERAGAGREQSRSHLLRVLAFLRRGEPAAVGSVLELPLGLRLRAMKHAFILVREPGAGSSEC